MALLYSWANIENAPYRDFSRQRKSIFTSAAQRAEGAGSEAVGERTACGASEKAVPSSATPGSATPGSATVDFCSPALPAGSGPKNVMSYQPLPAQLPRTQGLFPHDLPPIAKAEMRAVLPEPEPPGKTSSVLAVYSIAGGAGKTHALRKPGQNPLLSRRATAARRRIRPWAPALLFRSNRAADGAQEVCSARCERPVHPGNRRRQGDGSMAGWRSERRDGNLATYHSRPWAGL